MNGLCTMLEPGNVPRARSVVKLRFAVSRLPPRHQRYQKRRASSYKAKEFLERNGWLVTQRGPRAQTRSRTFAARRQLWGMNMLSRRALLTALFATGVVTGLATAIATAAPYQAETQLTLVAPSQSCAAPRGVESVPSRGDVAPSQNNDGALTDLSRALKKILCCPPQKTRAKIFPRGL